MITIMEQDEQPVVEQTETPVETPEVPEKVEQPQGPEPETPETPEEPAIELDGQHYTASQIKEMEKAYKNSTEWQKTNTQKAQEIAEQRRQLEERQARVAMLEGLAEKVQSNPDLLKQIFAPQQVRNLDDELMNHWQRRPLDTQTQEYVNWEYQKDLLVGQIAEEKAIKRATEGLATQNAQQHNTSIEMESYAKYKDKVSPEEFKQMAKWINMNVAAPQGRFPKDSFDIAYRNLYFDKALSDAALESSKKASESLLRAKPADGQNGRKPIDNQKTQSDLDDDAFIEAAMAAGRG